MQMTHIEDRRLFVLGVTSCCYEKQELSCLKMQPFFSPGLCLAQIQKGVVKFENAAIIPGLYLAKNPLSYIGSFFIFVWQCYRC